MSGHWSIEKVDNREALWTDERPAGAFSMMRDTADGAKQYLDAVTASIIWALPFTNIEEITGENVEEVFIRIRMIELSRGPLLTVNGEPAYISPSDVRRRIGTISVPGIQTLPFDESTIAALRSKAREAWDG